MSWVSPVKDDKALHEFEDGLKKAGEKYYVLFEIGLGTGLKLPDILDFRNRDVRGKESIELNIGKKNIRRIFKIPEKLQREIFCYTEGFVEPAVVMENGKPVATIEDGDSVIFFNFRPDRAREITRAFCCDDFTGFAREKRIQTTYVCFTDYDETIPNKEVAFFCPGCRREMRQNGC